MLSVLLVSPAGGVISYVGSCGGSPTRTSPVSLFSENSSSLPPSFLSSSSSSSGSSGEDGSSSAGGSPRGRDDGGSLRVSPSKSVASLTSKTQRVLCGDQFDPCFRADPLSDRFRTEWDGAAL